MLERNLEACVYSACELGAANPEAVNLGPVIEFGGIDWLVQTEEAVARDDGQIGIMADIYKIERDVHDGVRGRLGKGDFPTSTALFRFAGVLFPDFELEVFADAGEDFAFAVPFYLGAFG